MDEFLTLLSSKDGLLSIGAGVLTLVIIALYLVIMNRRHARSGATKASVAADASPIRGETPVEGKDLETALREEITANVQGMSESITRAMADIVRAQQVQNDAFHLKINELGGRGDGNTLERALSDISLKMDTLVRENNSRMEEMVRSVDEKLDATLEERFDARFQKVSEQMDQLYHGIEDVRSLSKDVYDLRRVLSGAKAGGMLGETQLSALISDILSPEQYEENKRLREDGERVTVAVRIPGRTPKEAHSYLPIDAKFSKESSTQLLYALDGGDLGEIEAAWVEFEDVMIEYARHVEREFIHPPLTTDFAVAFLPSDGLYAQALGRPRLAGKVQDESNVLLAGPTTLTALLNSLQMGYRTLAIERRSEEVWAMLGAVRGEFVNFADALKKTQKRINQASDAIEEAARKSRVIEQKLKGIESLDKEKQKKLFGESSKHDEFLREMREDWE